MSGCLFRNKMLSVGPLNPLSILARRFGEAFRVECSGANLNGVFISNGRGVLILSERPNYRGNNYV
jgi:hypothetical protein